MKQKLIFKNKAAYLKESTSAFNSILQHAAIEQPKQLVSIIHHLLPLIVIKYFVSAGRGFITKTGLNVNENWTTRVAFIVIE